MYLRTLILTWHKFRNMDRNEIKKNIREWDTESWKEEMLNRSTMKWYREAKMRIKYDECYSNSKASRYLARARTNSLQLQEYYGRREEDTFDATCPLCKKEDEDLEHFLVKCEKLEGKRNKEIMEEVKNMQPTQNTAYILFKLKNHESISDMIFAMWLFRKDLLKPP